MDKKNVIQVEEKYILKNEIEEKYMPRSEVEQIIKDLKNRVFKELKIIK